MVEETITDRVSAPSNWANAQPQRILLELEETEGIVQGLFARSSDVIAGQRIDSEGARHVLTYAVAGTLDGSKFRILFSAEAGQMYEVDAVVNERVIAGSYVARYSMGGDGVLVRRSYKWRNRLSRSSAGTALSR